MTPKEQLDKWVDGESLCPNDREECCPDFSCCCSDVDTPVEVRKAFRDAFVRGDGRLMEKFCMSFLGGALPKATDNKIHLAGTTPEDPN